MCIIFVFCARFFVISCLFLHIYLIFNVILKEEDVNVKTIGSNTSPPNMSFTKLLSLFKIHIFDRWATNNSGGSII